MVNFKSVWLNGITNVFKAFGKLKEDFEQYIKVNMKQFLTQLRFGTLPLEIQNGRIYTILRENRICKQCDTELIEKEIHFLLI